MDKKIVLGVASTWSERKGLNDFINLSRRLGENYQIVLIGLSERRKKLLPGNIIALSRTESVEELASYYSAADVFVNPTTADNFPTTNLEALACGTPVITYDTGGSPEAISKHTGVVVQKGDINRLHTAILSFTKIDKTIISKECRLRAEMLFNKQDRYEEYLDLMLTVDQ